MTKRRSWLPAIRPTTVALVFCLALTVGVPAAASVVEPTRAAHPSIGAVRSMDHIAADATAVSSSPTVRAASAVTSGAAEPPGPAAAVVPAYFTTTAMPGSAAAKAIEFALAQRGLPYVWGGDGPETGDAGFDCSGLTKAAYASAGIDLPRTAHTQFYAGPHVPDDAELQPGDLVFYGVPGHVHHVGLYLGGGRMVNAPDFGRPVQVASVRYAGDDYVGATRPAAGVGAPGLLTTAQLGVTVPATPAPDTPAGPTTFPAPVAPDPVPDAVLGPATAPELKTDLVLPDTAAGATVTPGPTSTAQVLVPTQALVPAAVSTTTAAAPPTGPSAAAVTTAPVVHTPAGPTAVTSTPATPTPATPTAAAPTPATSTPATSTPAAPATSAPPPTTSPTTAPTRPAPATTTTAPAPVAPRALATPGATLTLVRARTGANGLPTAPAATSTGALVWHAGAAGAGTAAVRLAPAFDPAGLTPGATLVATGPGGASDTLTIASRTLTTPAVATAAAAARAKGLRVVLLQTGAATGRILVITAT